MNEDQRTNMDDERIVPREVNLRFTGGGYQNLGWGILYLLSLLPLAIPLAWWHRGYSRWVARHITTTDGSTVTFAGEPKEIWYWFPPWGILMAAQEFTEAHWLTITLNWAEFVYGLALGWIVLRWMVNGVRLNDTAAFRFTGGLWAYLKWQVLMSLSWLTVVGWAWVGVAYQKWLYRHVASEQAELYFDGKPRQWLGIGALCYLLPAALFVLLARVPLKVLLHFLAMTFTGMDTASDTAFLDNLNAGAGGFMALYFLSLPWLLVWILGWFIRNTRLVVTTPAPVPMEEPVLAD